MRTVAIALFAAPLVAAPLVARLWAAVPPVEESPLFERHVDGESGVVSYVLKPGIFSWNQQSLYFTTKSMTDDGRFIVFDASDDERKGRTRKMLALADLERNSVMSLSVSNVIPHLDVENDRLYYVDSAGAHVRDLKADPLKDIILCPLPPELAALKRVNFYASHLTLTRDRRKAFLDTMSGGGNWWNQRYTQGMLDLSTGKYEPWGETEFCCNHGQASPTDDNLALVAWEFQRSRVMTKSDGTRYVLPRDPDELVPRVQLVSSNGNYRTIPSLSCNYATHETWTPDGKGIFWCGGAVWHLDLASGAQRKLCPYPAAHASMSADGRYLTYDRVLDNSWWRGCAWAVDFFDTETQRRVVVHTRRPPLAPKDKPSNLHPDPHPLFVCRDRYLLCTMNGPDNRMNLSLTPTAPLRQLAATPEKPPVCTPKRFDLQWNVRWPTEIPYEVEIDRMRLERLCGARRDRAIALHARVAGHEMRLPSQSVKSRAGRPEVLLRFTPPKGTEALWAVANSPEPERLFDSADVDNAFGGLLRREAVARWKGESSETKIWHTARGLRIAGCPSGGKEFHATCDVDLPPGLAGASVALEMDVTSRSRLVWGNRIRIRQLDASGNELPESVVDPRFISHARPPEVRCELRERGHIHPEARKLRIEIGLQHVVGKFDEYGRLIKNKTDFRPDLEIARLALRPARLLPFPKLADAHFAAGVSGEPGDEALAFGGENAFYYQTRSMASWAEGIPLVKQDELFYPFGEGTVEAWFKPSRWRSPNRSYALLSATHHLSRAGTTKALGRVWLGDFLEVSYRPSTNRIGAKLRDADGRVFSGEGAANMPTGVWTHVAFVFAPGGTAQLFVNGRQAFAFPLDGFKKLDLPACPYPNDAGPSEFFLGGGFVSARKWPEVRAESPLFEGAADLLRVSSSVRYVADFVPAKDFRRDAATRALFRFDRDFDGLSGGGAGFIPGTWRSLSGRRENRLKIGPVTIDYFPATNLLSNTPANVLNKLNYGDLPTPTDFRSARAVRMAKGRLKSGERLVVECPPGTQADFVEIANTGGEPLVWPMLRNGDEPDPRSFGDFADSCRLVTLKPRERVDAIFNFFLGASDYFMNHSADFAPGSDVPRRAEGIAPLILNGYCGFECGPLNGLVANFFACAGSVPAVKTLGYGHMFEQVFHDGDNHLYDLSAQTFFPSMDNMTAASLAECENEPGVFHRMGHTGEQYNRMSSRAAYAETPGYPGKMGMILNPGERFRAWFANDGAINDLQVYPNFGLGFTTLDRPLKPFKTDYVRETGSVPGKSDIWRIDRFFPEVGNGFVVFDGHPDPRSPAFADSGTNFCTYRVQSGYPVMRGEYRASLPGGATVPLFLSTDLGRTFRPLAMEADGTARPTYLVRGRHEYLVRANVSPHALATFRASTEVQFNTRVFPGRVHAGTNVLMLVADKGPAADVTVQYGVPQKEIAIAGGVCWGFRAAHPRQMVLLAPGETLRLAVSGASSAARAVVHGGLEASLEDGTLTLTAPLKEGRVLSHPASRSAQHLAAVDIVDGEASRSLVVLISENARLLAATDANLGGGLSLAPPGADRVQPALMFTHGATTPERAEFRFPSVPAGKYAAFVLVRFPARIPWGNTAKVVQLDFPSMAGPIPAAAYGSWSCNYFKVDYGKPDGRACFRWDYPVDPESATPYELIRVLDLPATDRLGCTIKFGAKAGIEVAGVLLMPYPSDDFRCDLLKLLCGVNFEPWRVCSGLVRKEKGNAQ